MAQTYWYAKAPRALSPWAHLCQFLLICIANWSSSASIIFATVHSATVSDVPERIISTFPEDEQDQIRSQIANVATAFIAQTLVRKEDKGRIAAFEILRVNAAARNLIREHKSFQLDSVMQTQRRDGMITMMQSLVDLYADGLISGKMLIENAPDVSRARKYVKDHPSK